MRKKLLLSQNASLFAELERKASEIKTLEIKLEDLEKEYTNAREAFIELEIQTEQLEKEKAELKQKVAALETIKEKYDVLKQSALTPDATSKVSEPFAITVDEKENSKDIAEPHWEENSATENCKEVETLEQELKEKPKEVTKEDLKTLGIKAIGDVTKAAALAIAKLGDDEASFGKKSLIMGKNEGFKFEVLSILQSPNPSQDCCQKIELLALEAINHIDSIIG